MSTGRTLRPGHREGPSRWAGATPWWPLGPIVLCVALGGLYLVAAARPGFWTNQDFAVYYAYGQALRHGLSLYAPAPGTSMPFTYPPFAAWLLSVFTFLGFPAATRVMVVASVAALVVMCWLLLGACGARRRVRLGAACLLAGVALWWEPVQFNLLLGQVNLFVCLAVVVSSTRRGGWATGVGVGLAAGFKLTPGLFVVYFLVTRQFRAFWASTATFLLTVAVGAALSPADSRAYWGGGFAGGSIATVTPGSFVANQSLHGLAIRLLAQDGGRSVTLLWLGLAAGAGLLGLAVARRAHRDGDELLAMTCVGLVTVLVSPVSWSHHWVWFVPALVGFWLSASRRGLLRSTPRRAAAALLTGGYLALLATWPGQRQGVRQPTGIIWSVPWNPFPDGDRPEFRWTSQQALAGNAYVVAGCTMLLLALLLTTVRPAARARAGRPRHVS